MKFIVFLPTKLLINVTSGTNFASVYFKQIFVYTTGSNNSIAISSYNIELIAVFLK